jgi:hypothetical protein
MVDTKFIFTIIGLSAVIFAVCKVNLSGKKSTENFWMNPTMSIKVDRGVTDSKNGQRGYSLQNTYQNMLGNNKFVSTPSFQGILAPRFSNTNYGANIRYNMPSYENQGAPCDPLSMGDMARENYSANAKRETRENYGCSMGNCGGGFSGGCGDGNGCGVQRCNKNGGSPTANMVTLTDQAGLETSQGFMANKSYSDTMNKVYQEYGSTPGTATLAIGDMQSIDADGLSAGAGQGQPIVYDRYIYANLKNTRLRSQGDPIRGDLAIAPCNQGWFNVSVNPVVDLQPGALNVIGGTTNEQGRSLAELQYLTSGNSKTTWGGVNMANQFNSVSGAGMSDVNVRAFA